VLRHAFALPTCPRLWHRPVVSDQTEKIQAQILRYQAALERLRQIEAEETALAAEKLALLAEVDSGLSSAPRHSTMTGTEMTSSELRKLPGEQRRRLGIARAQSNDHPFPRALYKDGKTVTAWAARRKLNRNVVKAWFAKEDAVRPIPRKYAEEIARDYPEVHATEAIWRGGIKG
jgi:hypothetical protein